MVSENIVLCNSKIVHFAIILSMDAAEIGEQKKTMFSETFISLRVIII